VAYGEEGGIFTGPQAIEESATGEGALTRPKGALEPDGQPLGRTAPLNGDRASEPTARSQSTHPESIRITRAIRQHIIERRDLSTAAKNVKIITDDNGAVTLRGPVKTENEKQEIEQIARNNAQGAQVTSNLIVKGEHDSKGGAHG
jgi:hypothetical protein